MDPDATLHEMLELAYNIVTGTDVPYRDSFANAEILAELVQNMDTWLQRGGFLPRRWQKAGGKPRKA